MCCHENFKNFGRHRNMLRKKPISEPGKQPKAKSRRVFAAEAEVQVQKKKTMKAAAIDQFGPPSVLQVHELTIPEVAPNEVRTGN